MANEGHKEEGGHEGERNHGIGTKSPVKRIALQPMQECGAYYERDSRGAGVPHHLVNILDYRETAINLVHYKENVPLEVQMAKARDIEREDDQKKPDDWETR